jgi:hypothetical protein
VILAQAEQSRWSRARTTPERNPNELESNRA